MLFCEPVRRALSVGGRTPCVASKIACPRLATLPVDVLCSLPQSIYRVTVMHTRPRCCTPALATAQNARLQATRRRRRFTPSHPSDPTTWVGAALAVMGLLWLHYPSPLSSKIWNDVLFFYTKKMEYFSKAPLHVFTWVSRNEQLGPFNFVGTVLRYEQKRAVDLARALARSAPRRGRHKCSLWLIVLHRRHRPHRQTRREANLSTWPTPLGVVKFKSAHILRWLDGA